MSHRDGGIEQFTRRKGDIILSEIGERLRSRNLPSSPGRAERSAEALDSGAGSIPALDCSAERLSRGAGPGKASAAPHPRQVRRIILSSLYLSFAEIKTTKVQPP